MLLHGERGVDVNMKRLGMYSVVLVVLRSVVNQGLEPDRASAT